MTAHRVIFYLGEGVHIEVIVSTDRDLTNEQLQAVALTRARAEVLRFASGEVTPLVNHK